MPITFPWRKNDRLRHFKVQTHGGKTCIYGSETNYVRVCLFYILNKDVPRKVSVEIRKRIDSNDTFCSIRACNLSYTFAVIVEKVCRRLSGNGSVFQRGIVEKVCRFCDFGTIALPRKEIIFSHAILPVLHVSLVLVANLFWQNGKPLVAKNPITSGLK